MRKFTLKLPVIAFFLFFGVFGFAKSSFAATINTASCSLTDINSAISNASTGDTVSVPTGSCAWTGTLVFSKNIKLIGAGKSNTIITCRSDALCVWSESSNNVRISGFTFDSPASTGITIIEMDSGTGWRVDHNHLEMTAHQGIAVAVSGTSTGVFPYGLVDNNEIYNAGVVVNGSGQPLLSSTDQDVLWAQDPDLGGGTDAMYVEQNTYVRNLSSTELMDAIDSNYGGRFVIRFNTLTTTSAVTTGVGWWLAAHSVQGTNRGTQRWEIYGNSLVCNGTLGCSFPANLRAGTGVMFNNYVGPTSAAWTYYDIILDNVRNQTGSNCTTTAPYYCCDGTHPGVDQNSSGGYACRDQIGYGRDAVQWCNGVSCTPTGAWNQVKMPVYQWGNGPQPTCATSGSCDNSLTFAVAGYVDVDTPIQANRDYYNYDSTHCVADGTSCSQGVGAGTLANRPPNCTTGVGYWATDQGSWNQSGSGGQGVLYKCSATNTWTLYYTPYTYPHPLQGIIDNNPPAAPSGLAVN